MGEGKLIEQAGDAPLTQAVLAADLRALGLGEGEVVLCHTSLSALGWVCGGPVAVVEALIEVLDESGTLVMPAHSSGLSDPSLWDSPPVPRAWWPVIRENTPAYDPASTPTRGMGAVADVFRTMADVQRSSHPLMSFCARGPEADWILDPHPLRESCGEGSPIARLYEIDARVLLLGCGHESNTSLHLAEHRAQWPGRRRVTQGAPMRVDGERRWVAFEELDYESDDFEAIGVAFADQVHEGRVGRGRALLMSQRELVDFGVRWIEANRR